MESIDILTGQHVTIQYKPATLLARAGALLLDYFFMSAYSTACICAMTVLINANVIHNFQVYYILFVIVVVLPVMTYHFLFETLLGGRTLGKMIVRISVVNIDGSPPGIGAYFLRWILMPVDLFPFGGLGSLLIVFSLYHQRLGDMAAGTIVVKNSFPSILDLDESYYEFDDEYEPAFKNVSCLTEGQIRFISNLLVIKNRESALESIHAAANKIKDILKIDSSMNDRLFLETLVRDYNYYATLGI
jgi:uncharacterized RDD family membrane protein YckC